MMLTGKKLTTVYRPKTIPEVFGIKPEHRVRVVNAPPNDDKIMSGYPFEKRVSSSRGQIDMAHVFVEEPGGPPGVAKRP